VGVGRLCLYWLIRNVIRGEYEDWEVEGYNKFLDDYLTRVKGNDKTYLKINEGLQVALEFLGFKRGEFRFDCEGGF